METAIPHHSLPFVHAFALFDCGIVKGIRDLTLGTDTSKPDGKSVLPATPDAQMITFYLDEGVVTLRNSGTEPKLKFYVECM